MPEPDLIRSATKEYDEDVDDLIGADRRMKWVARFCLLAAAGIAIWIGTMPW